MATTSVDTEQMREMERRFVDGAWNQGDMAALSETHSESATVHWSREFTDTDSLRAYISEVREAFPDFNMTIDFTVAEGDRIATGFTASGTHEAPLRGIPATGKFIRFSGLWTHRYEDGVIVEGWTSWDELGIRKQLGMTFPRVLVTLPVLYGKKLLATLRSRRA
jgi:steroid delta-isomerase-like uncharacterized protein